MTDTDPQNAFLAAAQKAQAESLAQIYLDSDLPRLLKALERLPFGTLAGTPYALEIDARDSNATLNLKEIRVTYAAQGTGAPRTDYTYRFLIDKKSVDCLRGERFRGSASASRDKTRHYATLNEAIEKDFAPWLGELLNQKQLAKLEKLLTKKSRPFWRRAP